jgi:hypothetical protein
MRLPWAGPRRASQARATRSISRFHAYEIASGAGDAGAVPVSLFAYPARLVEEPCPSASNRAPLGYFTGIADLDCRTSRRSAASRRPSGAREVFVRLKRAVGRPGVDLECESWGDHPAKPVKPVEFAPRGCLRARRETGETPGTVRALSKKENASSSRRDMSFQSADCGHRPGIHRRKKPYPVGIGKASPEQGL